MEHKTHLENAISCHGFRRTWRTGNKNKISHSALSCPARIRCAGVLCVTVYFKRPADLSIPPLHTHPALFSRSMRHVLCAWIPDTPLSIRYICREMWPSRVQEYYYTLALFTLQFVLPLVVLIFTYTRIAIAVWGKRPPGEAENSRDQRMARSKRKVSLQIFNRIFNIPSHQATAKTNLLKRGPVH